MCMKCRKKIFFDKITAFLNFTPPTAFDSVSYVTDLILKMCITLKLKIFLANLKGSERFDHSIY